MNTLTAEELKRIEKDADAYVSNHPDSEVRRMFGHYYRVYAAGATKEALRAKKIAEALKAMLKEFDNPDNHSHQRSAVIDAKNALTQYNQ